MAPESPTSTTSTPGRLGGAGAGKVVGGDHDDRLAEALHLRQARERDREAVDDGAGGDLAGVGGHQRPSFPNVRRVATSWSTPSIALRAGLDVDDGRLVLAQLGAVVLRVGDDDDRVAAVHEAGGGPVDLHRARAALAGDRVGLEAGAVVDVDDVDLLVLEDVGGLEQVGVDGDRADVVQVAVGHRRPVDLGLQHRSLHQRLPGVPLRMSLSIRRTSPTRAATATSTGCSPTVGTGAKVSGRDELEVLRLDVELGHRGAADGGEDRGVALAGGVAGADRLQAAVQRQRAGAVVAGQPHVAAGQGEPVGLADGRADLDPHRDVEVAHDAADDRDLLGVLLAEERDVGLGDVQQLRHDRRHAGEVRRAALGALQRRADLVDRDRRREAERVDLAGRRARRGCRRPASAASVASRASSRG